MGRRTVVLSAAVAAGLVVAALPGAPASALGAGDFVFAGRYSTGAGEATAEISAYDGGRLYVTNGMGIDIVDISDPSDPTKIGTLPIAGSSLGEPTSVAAKDGLVVVAVPNADKVRRGVVKVFAHDRLIDTVTVGSLPDMVTYTPNGARIVVANEGEPNSYGRPNSVDPEGSVSIIPTAPYAPHFELGPDRFAAAMKAQRELKQESANRARLVRFTSFNEGQGRHRQLPDGVRIFGPGATVAQDLEPEYVATTDSVAHVTLQENNAIARIDLAKAKVLDIVALGSKDHSLPGNGLDASDKDGVVNIQPWPVKGLFLPDGMARYVVGGQGYLITANEGDARDYDGFSEEERAADFADLTLFPEADDDAQLGRLNVTTAFPAPSDGSALYSFGARSISIWKPNGELVWDSGDQLEQIVDAANPSWFNSDNDEDTFDTRSDNKGPEPEGVAVGEIDGQWLAFVVLERVGGVVVFDVTDPTAPTFVDYLESRAFGGTEVGPDAGPEAVVFIPAATSPTGRAMIAVSHEVTGTVALFEATPAVP